MWTYLADVAPPAPTVSPGAIVAAGVCVALAVAMLIIILVRRSRRQR